jgi:hypothetical protein
MSSQLPRRRFLQASAISSIACGLPWTALPKVSAQEAQGKNLSVQFAADIEPLVRLLETTPRADVIGVCIKKIQSGLSYQQLLAALQLAGIRNVQPRPSVGFKFHSVLVVNSAHLASIASPDEHRWLPILWAIDNFKSSQAQDERENNWTMSPVDEAHVPNAAQAESQFATAMDNWEEAPADTAAAGLARTVGATRVFDQFIRFGVRDFRSIGHKAIFVANAWRTLQTIGWRHAEPILRSLAYALLNYDGHGSPATRDELADRPGRENTKRVTDIRDDWLDGKLDDAATVEMLDAIRAGTYQDTSALVVQQLNRGIAPQSIWDGMFAAASEMLMRQPGIVSLHTLTTTNAMRFAFDTCGNEETRKLILLQNAAFLPLFRIEMTNRGNVGEQRIDQLAVADSASGSAVGNTADSVAAIFELIGKDNSAACYQTLGYLQRGGDVTSLMDAARLLIFQKGTDSHDYKFSSAVLEDFYHVSPNWRNRCLAASVYKLRSSRDADNKLTQNAAQSLRRAT